MIGHGVLRSDSTLLTCGFHSGVSIVSNNMPNAFRTEEVD